MEITGKIYQLGENIGGTSITTGKEWVRKTVVIETIDMEPKKLAFSVTGVDRVTEWEEKNVGDIVRVNFTVSSRQYEGKWFTELRAYGVEKLGAIASESKTT